MFGVSTAKVDNNYDLEERTELLHEQYTSYHSATENGIMKVPWKMVRLRNFTLRN